MKLFNKLVFMTFMCSYLYGTAQNTDMVKKKGPDDTYARSSISYLLLDFPDERFSDMIRSAMNSTTLPSKFDKNDIPKKYIQAPYRHSEHFSNFSANSKSILQSLINEKYALDMLKYWWKIDENGSYSTSLIKSRGEYNATDNVYDEAMASKVGRAKIGDQGIKLIANSYVLVVDYHSIKTMEEIYDEQDKKAREKAKKDSTVFKPVKRTKNGFVGKVTSYLYQINYSDTVQGFFDASFIDDKQIDLTKLEQVFSEVYSPLKLVTTTTEPAEGTQPNPGEFLAPAVQKTKEELIVLMVNNGITKSMDRFETKLEAFRVKTPVTNLSPIRAKIGKKESLTHERRYFVWEYVSNSSNKVIAKKKGVLRAGKVVDNRNDELGSTKESSFYQIGGGKITEGMTLQEAKDMGIGASVGYGSEGLILRADINIGQWANLPMKQWKLYGEFNISSKEYDPESIVGSMPTGPSDYSSSKISAGLLKDIVFMRNFHMGLFAGYSMETITWEDAEDQEKLSTSGLQWGAKFGMNLFSPSVQLIGTINGFGYGNIIYTPSGEDPKDLDLEVGWDKIFPEKQSVAFDLTLRFNF